MALGAAEANQPVAVPTAATTADAATKIIVTPLAEPTVVSGQVFEKGSRKRLTGVNVFLLPQQLKVVTDQDGKFRFTAAAVGEVEIIINVTNYEKFSRKIKLTGDLENLRLYVAKAQLNYFETTITDTRNRRDDSEKRLEQSEFLTVPGSGGDPVKAVQNLPGVNRVGGWDSRVVIQGAEPEDSKYNIEGHEVPLIFHFGGLSSIVTPEAVDSVNYLSSGYGPEFSRALGGHVGLTVSKPKLDRTQGMAFMDIFNVGGLVQGPISSSSGYLVSGRYSYVGEVFKQLAKDNENFNLTVAPVFYDFNAQYYKKINDRDEFRVFSIISKDELEFVLSKPVNNDPALRGDFSQETWFYRVIPQWTRQIDRRRKLDASVGYGSNDINFDVTDNYFRLTSSTLSVRSDFENKVSGRYKYNLGLDNLYNWYRVSVRLPDTYSEGGVSNPLASGELKERSVKGESHVIGVYFRNELKPIEDSRWTFIPSLRFNRFVLTDENLLEPRAAIRFAPSESLIWRLATGLYHQVPSGQESDSTFGNSQIRSQRTRQYALGIEKDFRQNRADGWLVSLTGFYKTLDRMIIPSSKYVERDGVLVTENYSNDGTGRIQGVETQVKFKSQSWSVTGAYTYLVSRRQSPSQPELPSPYDQRHSFNLLTSYASGSWLYGVRTRYVTGNPYTPVVGATFDSDNDVYVPKRGESYSEREDAFFQVDARIDHKWIYDTFTLSAYLDVQNLTNRKNQEGRTYAYDYSESQKVTGLPILPTIGVKGEF